MPLFFKFKKFKENGKIEMFKNVTVLKFPPPLSHLRAFHLQDYWGESRIVSGQQFVLNARVQIGIFLCLVVGSSFRKL